jgi:hypothetical protein
MSDSDDKIKPLPVKFKKPPGDEPPFLKVVHYGGPCNHQWFWRGDPTSADSRMVNVTYLIREGETEVECSNCGTKLDPMWVLRRMATEETQWLRTRERYMDEMKRLRERSRTKCWHCGKMTEISRR